MEAQKLQLGLVNTNSRYLSQVHSQLLLALTAKLPDPLKVLYLVNSGSEANDLALQIAMAARPLATHIACMGGAYHGHVTSMMQASPYKFWGPRGAGGPPQHVHVLPLPDVYRCVGSGVAVVHLFSPPRSGGPCMRATYCPISSRCFHHVSRTVSSAMQLSASQQ